MLRILLIEDEFIIIKDIRSILSKDHFAEVDAAKNYQSAIDLFTKNTYDLIISDINLNDVKDGIEIITELGRIKTVPVVYLTAYSDAEIISRAKKTMPFAYILKPYNDNQLKLTINLALLNFKKETKSFVEDKENTSKLNLLTCREKEILVTLAAGKISKEVAETLKITPYTVEQHKKNIKRKLNLSTVGELIRFTMTSRLLELCKNK